MTIAPHYGYAPALMDLKGSLAEFAERLFKPSLEQITQKLRAQNKLSGEVLQKKALEEIRKPAIGCFVAGTLVHTREGLRPIEQIQVGDYVLSKPESGDGETSYQPVTKTFSYEDRELYRVGMTELDPATGRFVNVETEYIAVTGAHPIWVQCFKQFKWGEDEPIITSVNNWVSVEDIYEKNRHAYWQGPAEQLTSPDTHVLLANGAPAVMGSPLPILKGLEPDHGVLFRDTENWVEDDCSGTTVRFGAHGVENVRGETYLREARHAGYDYTSYDTESDVSVVKRSNGHLPIRRTVYNLEVAHNHSYFVGELGLWVHNTSGLELRSLPASPTKNVGGYVGEETETRFKDALASTSDGKKIGVKPDISVPNSGGSAAQAVAI